MNLLGLPGCNEKKNILWCFLLNLSVVKKLWGRFFSSKKRGHRFLSESFLELILFLKLIPSCFFLNSPFHVYQIALPKRQQLSRKASQEPTTRYIWFVDSQNCRWCARKESSSPKKNQGRCKHGWPSWPQAVNLRQVLLVFFGGEGGWSHAKFIQILLGKKCSKISGCHRCFVSRQFLSGRFTDPSLSNQHVSGAMLNFRSIHPGN